MVVAGYCLDVGCMMLFVRVLSRRMVTIHLCVQLFGKEEEI